MSKEDRSFAEWAAIEAGNVTLRWFGQGGMKVERKADQSPVTAADRASEEFIREAIEKAYPDDGVLGEEFGEKHGTSGRRWIIDPIDGTKNFIRGVPLYGTMIALEDSGEHTVGVIRYPATGETLSAAKGLGCTLDGEACRVSETKELSDAFATTTSLENWLDKLGDASLLRLIRGTRMSRTWGDCYGYMLVATGRVDVMIDPIVEVHDFAALLPIITEAGGKLTSFAGDVPKERSSVVATNGLLHERALKLLNQT